MLPTAPAARCSHDAPPPSLVSIPGVLSALTAIVAVAVAASCGRGDGQARSEPPGPAAVAGASPTEGAGAMARPFRVGVLYWSSSIKGQLAMRAGLEAEVKAINARGDGPGVELIRRVAGDGAHGRQRQIAQMKELIDARVDAIVVQPTDNAALSGELRRANALEVPVVAFDQYIEGGHLHAYVTSDNRQAGRLDGEYIAHHFPDDRVLRLVLVEYPHVSSTVERLDGFLSALHANGQRYEIVGTYKAVEPVAGREAGAQILADFPARGSVDVVFTVNDGGGLAVVEALAAAGRDEIAVASIDGDPQSVANIAAGRLTVVDAAQFCGPLGAQAMRATYAVLRGREVAEYQLIPTFPVTRQTLGRYPGWMGPVPEAFELPWPSAKPRWSPALRSGGGS